MITDEMVERGAKALYELHPLSAAMPMWENLNDNFKVEWRERVKVVLRAALEADGKSQELDAQCAAMRKALEYACDYFIARGYKSYHAQIIIRMCREALSASAGRDMLELVKELEKSCKRVSWLWNEADRKARGVELQIKSLSEWLKKLEAVAEAVGEFIQAEESDGLDVADECYGKLKEVYEAWERSVYYA